MARSRQVSSLSPGSPRWNLGFSVGLAEPSAQRSCKAGMRWRGLGGTAGLGGECSQEPGLDLEQSLSPDLSCEKGSSPACREGWGSSSEHLCLAFWIT